MTVLSSLRLQPAIRRKGVHRRAKGDGRTANKAHAQERIPQGWQESKENCGASSRHGNNREWTPRRESAQARRRWQGGSCHSEGHMLDKQRVFANFVITADTKTEETTIPERHFISHHHPPQNPIKSRPHRHPPMDSQR